MYSCETLVTVRDHTVALHLSDSEPQTTVTTTTLSDWLAREGLHRSPRARVDLVVDHVLGPVPDPLTSLH
jgi:hypothetical protein